MELEGRVALITGASRGIGQGIAKSMAEAGANIVVNYQRNKAGAEQTARDVEALGAKALLYQANVKNLNEVQAMVDKAVETFGTVDILINNAGQHYSKSVIADDALDVFHDVVGTHINGSFYCTQAVLPHMMKKKRGDIHFISSLATKQLWADEWAYASVKAWMNTFVMTSAKELSLARDPGQRHCAYHRGVGYGSETGHGLGKDGRPAEPGWDSSLRPADPASRRGEHVHLAMQRQGQPCLRSDYLSRLRDRACFA